VSGGTLKDGVYYIQNLTGPVTTTNATLVVFGNISISGNGTFNLQAPPTSPSPGANNKGLALVSPNAISVSFGGTVVLQLAGAIYLPSPGSSISLAGTVNAPCAQVIAGTISLSGNDQFGNDGTCGVSNITTPGSAKLVQ
jgi:hypothetical protein